MILYDFCDGKFRFRWMLPIIVYSDRKAAIEKYHKFYVFLYAIKGFFLESRWTHYYYQMRRVI